MSKAKPIAEETEILSQKHSKSDKSGNENLGAQLWAEIVEQISGKPAGPTSKPKSSQGQQTGPRPAVKTVSLAGREKNPRVYKLSEPKLREIRKQIALEIEDEAERRRVLELIKKQEERARRVREEKLRDKETVSSAQRGEAEVTETGPPEPPSKTPRGPQWLAGVAAKRGSREVSRPTAA